MMERHLNQARREAERVMSRLAMIRIGIVSSYDPDNYSAKVRIQPEDIETGWMPIGSGMGGNGFGDFYGPIPGDIVYVHFQEGGKLAPFIGGFHFGDEFRPLAVPSGERWTVHKSGSFLKFLNDGTIAMTGHSNINVTAPSVNITGNLNVTGDIIDRTLTGGRTMANFRAAYDLHIHGGVVAGGGTTDVPTVPL